MGPKNSHRGVRTSHISRLLRKRRKAATEGGTTQRGPADVSAATSQSPKQKKVAGTRSSRDRTERDGAGAVNDGA